LLTLDGRLTRVDAQRPFPFDGAWSPDGARIAFSGENCQMDSCDPTGIYTMGARGSDVRLLFARELVREPLWSPDGRSLAFALPFAGGSGLWVVGADGRGARLVRAIDRLSFSWAPDGRRLAIGRCKDFAHGDCAIYTVRADGTRLRRITRKLTHWEADNESVPTSPAWSPDGKQIAFTRYEDTAIPEVHVVGSDGHDEHRVAPGASSRRGRRMGADWSSLCLPGGCTTTS